MTTFRIITQTSTFHDDVMGGTGTVEWVAHQPVNKDGRDSKRRARRTGACTVRWADGSSREYGSNGVLTRENVTKERLAAERNYPGHH